MMSGGGMQWRPGFLPDHRHAQAWIVLTWLFALAAPFAETLWRDGAVRLTILAFTFAVAIFWEIVFAALMRRQVNSHVVVAALGFAILAPADAALWQLGLGISFASVVAIHVFGGYGWTFLNHSVVAFAFLLFAFPGGPYGTIEFPSWPFVVPAALALLALGVVSWITLAAMVAAYMIVISTIAGTAQLAGAPVLFFPAIVLACDPVASPATRAGRLAYGLAVGGLTALLSVSGKASAEAVFSAILLGAIFAPLFDHAAVHWHMKKREERDG